MLVIVRGLKTPSRGEVGEILYNGSDADDANKAVADNADKFPRIDISLAGIEGWFRTVQHYDENHPAVNKAEPVADTAPEEKHKKSKK